MRVFSAVIAIAVGLLTLLGYFVPAFAGLQIYLLNWTVILVGAATLVGALNLLAAHTNKIRRREKNYAYSSLLVMGLVAALIFGMARQTAVVSAMMNGIILPAEAALLGLLTVTLVYAAIRLTRRRADVMSISFLVTAIVLMLGFATLPFGNIPFVDVFSRWVTQALALGGARGIIIGVSLGALTTGLRVLFGADRPYGGN